MLTVADLVLALFVAGVFALVLGSSRLIFAVEELRGLGKEHRNIVEEEAAAGPEERRDPDDNPEREKFESHVVDFERGMRICKAELIVGYVLLALTLLIAVTTSNIDGWVFIGVIVALFVLLVFWANVRRMSEELHESIRGTRTPID
jgi:Sec-independent protein translocase protein TatA